MPYRNILVHAGNDGNAKAVLDVACQIACDHDAQVTGIHVVPSVYTAVYPEGSISANIVKQRQRENAGATDKAREMFETAARQSGCSAVWMTPEGYLDEEVIRLSRYADLVVIGQNGGTKSSSASHGIENNILLGSARPVLIVPYAGFSRVPGSRILVAWNDSVESTRAVNDALPLLMRASQVEVVSVTDNPDADVVPTADICHYLARHGVKAEAGVVQCGDRTTAEALLSRAVDKDIDLIVMGAYGHSRLREVVLGGATWNILKHMTVPILMSH